MLLNQLYYLLLGCLISKQSTTAFIISSYSPSSLLIRSKIEKTKHGTRTDGSELYNYRSSDEDGVNTNQDSSSKTTSIGDVVQNLHGGKYQFSETQYLAGSSLIGQQFAESLYSSSSEGEHDEGIVGNEDDDDTELPKWAIRLQDPIEQLTKPIQDTLIFDERYTLHTITIQNDERSWERFYAFIFPTNTDDDCCMFKVSPTTGTLAPRGGASNICDETKPYLDSALVSIEWDLGKILANGNNVENEWLLVVGTEAEVWRYRLKI